MLASAGLLAVASIVAVVVIELLTDLTDIRAFFNERAVRRWLFGPKTSSENSRQVHLQIEKDLSSLAAAGQTTSLYRPGLSQVAAQLNAAAEQILDLPHGRGDLLKALAGLETTASPSKTEDAKNGATLQLLNDVEMLAALKDGYRFAAKNGETHVTDARLRLSYRIQRRLDDLQLRGRMEWRIFLLALASGVATATCALATQSAFWALENVRLGVVAGLLTPVTYDILNVLRGKRRP